MLTVMFCDLQGSTQLSRQLDPEDMREVLRSYQSTVEEVVSQVGGHIAQFLGDGLLVYFGYPEAHDNDAERAVSSGLDILGAIDALNERLVHTQRVRIAVRIGVHTGLSVVGAVGGRFRTEQLAVGDTPNVAARLQQRAETNSLVISDATTRLVSGLFQLRSLGELTLAGVEVPIRAHHVVGRQAARSRLEAAAPHELSPLVGREQELSSLLQRWQEAVTGRGGSVVLSGEPGIGKSRLVHELRGKLAGMPHLLVVCRGMSIHTHSAFHAIADAAPMLFDFEPQALAKDKLRRVAEVLERLHIPVAEELPLLAGLLALPLEEGSPSLPPQLRRQRTLELLTRVFLRLAAEQPLALLIEDLHWLDQSSLEFFGGLAQALRNTRLFMLATTRPEARAPWSVDTELSLRHLPVEAVRELVQHAASAVQLPDEVITRIIDRASGNPLFIEELTKMASELGPFDTAARDAGDFAIPATLQESLMARLDRMSHAKRLVQLGAIIGRQFSTSLLRHVSGLEELDVFRELERLVEVDVLERQGLGEHATYAFRHALLRDAAYASLTRRTRQQYHERVGKTLSAHFPGTAPEELAHHYTEAGEMEEAIEHWRRAGELALASWGIAEAVNHLQRALALVPQHPQPQRQPLLELQLRVRLGTPLALLRGFSTPEMEANCRRLLALCVLVGPSAAQQLFPAYWGLFLTYITRAMYADAQAVGAQVLELAEHTREDGMRLAAHQAIATARMMRGDLQTARQHFEASRALYDPARHAALTFILGHDAAGYCDAFLGWVHALMGNLEEARLHAGRALEHCQRLGEPGTQAFVEAVVAVYYCLVGEPSHGVELSRRLISLAEKEGMPHWRAHGQSSLGWALMLGGKPEAGAREARTGMENYLKLGARSSRSFFAAALVEAELELGRVEVARQVLDETLAFVKESDEVLYLAELYLLEGRLALLSQDPDRRARATVSFERGLQVARNQGARALEARLSSNLARLS
jgi:class 3 adenylate cyclase/tetratricopeptide (TPR) repeat protein